MKNATYRRFAKWLRNSACQSGWQVIAFSGFKRPRRGFFSKAYKPDSWKTVSKKMPARRAPQCRQLMPVDKPSGLPSGGGRQATEACSPVSQRNHRRLRFFSTFP
ncbi:hypothetical protein ABC383_20615 [Noviherbaspirillum sp. 1P10PC]|uniref:hypothetical protein n=1 Tax=Noviherbaspirillum sp. 1P10PC TaxID=3132292 RepID=UPI0039A183A5